MGTICLETKYGSWPFRTRAEFKQQHFQFSFCPFQTESILNEWSSLNSIMTVNGTDLGKVSYTKVVYNFDIFSVNINTSSSDKWFRSNEFWKSGDAAENSSFLDNLTIHLKFNSSSQRKSKELKTPKS
jgi:hypothetical protein